MSLITDTCCQMYGHVYKRATNRSGNRSPNLSHYSYTIVLNRTASLVYLYEIFCNQTDEFKSGWLDNNYFRARM